MFVHGNCSEVKNAKTLAAEYISVDRVLRRSSLAASLS